MHAPNASSDFPGQRTRALSGAGDEEAFETKASPPAVAGPLVSQQGSLRQHGVSQDGAGRQRAGQHGNSPAGFAGHGVAPAAKSTQHRASSSGSGQHNGILLDLVTGTQTLLDSLDLLASAAARTVVGTGNLVIECGVVVRQPKRSPVVTGTSADAVRLLEWEQEAREGPVCDVLAGGHPVAVLQRSGDFRWPRYSKELQVAGFGSILGMRLRIDQEMPPSTDGAVPVRDTTAALAFFAQDAKAFPLQVIAEARSFAGLAAKSLHMALDLHTARSTASDLRLALDSRTSINVACGVIMAQNRCSYHEAFSILARASSHRNIKVRRVAEEILERLPEGPPKAHFGH